MHIVNTNYWIFGAMRRHLVKRVLICNIVHYNGSLAVTVVDGAQGVVPLLARCVLE